MKKISFLIVFSLFATPLLQAYSTNFTDRVANHYLSAFKTIDSNQSEEKAKKKGFSQQNLIDHLRAIMAPRELGLQELGPREMAEIEFKAVPSAPQEADIIDFNYVDKMELVKNLNNTTPQDHLISRLTKSPKGHQYLQTTMGHNKFVQMITQPVANLETLEKRQTIIKELVHNDALRTECRATLKKMSDAEALFYDLHLIKELKELEKTLYFAPFFDKAGLNRPVPLSIGTRGQQGFQVLGTSLSLVMAILVRTFGHRLYEKAQENNELAKQGLGLMGVYSVISPIVSIISLGTLKQQVNATLNIQERLIGASSYLTGIKKLLYSLNMNPTIRAVMPELKQISNDLHFNNKKSHEFNELNSLLSKSTFDEGKPSVFSSVGNVLVAYKQFMKESVRAEYADAKNLLGELDVYVALAQKIKEREHSRATFCFVKFKKNANKPMIKAVDFWNPFVAPQKVVCNTVTLNDKGERNILLTGPNTGGKSTLMKALMLATLLAQTFGIAPAQEMKLSIFTKLPAYLNISDDTASGISLFKAEVTRAQELMSALRSLPPHRFAFVIIDEIFTGTAPEKAEMLSYDFIKKMSSLKNCIFIIATHFPKLVEIEKETNGICKNYHTGVIINPVDPSKVAKYTYKLTPGPSPINNAQQVAEESGIEF